LGNSQPTETRQKLLCSYCAGASGVDDHALDKILPVSKNLAAAMKT
jgi:hypothetical protein